MRTISPQPSISSMHTHDIQRLVYSETIITMLIPYSGLLCEHQGPWLIIIHQYHISRITYHVFKDYYAMRMHPHPQPAYSFSRLVEPDTSTDTDTTQC